MNEPLQKLRDENLRKSIEESDRSMEMKYEKISSIRNRMLCRLYSKLDEENQKLQMCEKDSQLYQYTEGRCLAFMSAIEIVKETFDNREGAKNE